MIAVQRLVIKDPNKPRFIATAEMLGFSTWSRGYVCGINCTTTAEKIPACGERMRVLVLTKT
jgi:hypothetical protein